MSADPVEELLAAYAELLEAGDETSPEAFAAGRGIADEAALDALRRLAETHAMFADNDGDLTPRRVGPYRILGVLGRGGVGVVFRAVRDDAPETTVALKVLSLPSATSRRAVERFRREARALERIKHPGVVRVRDAGESDEGAYVAMDLVEGSPLSEAGAPDAREAARIVAALARATAAAHAAGVVHRDIKPSNVILKSDGAPVLLDFGLAFEVDASTLTHSGDVLGTPRYMAPEQAAGRAGGPAVDVYALGAILHELVAGTPPHGPLSPARTTEVVRSEPAPPCATFAPSAPPLLCAIVDRAVAFDATRRYVSAAALADDLEAWLADRPTFARPPSSVEKFGRALRRRRRLIAGAVVLVAAAAIGGALVSTFGASAHDEASYARAATEAAEAYADGDLPRAKSAAAKALSLRAAAPEAAILVAAADGALPETSDDATWRAFLKGEKLRLAENPREAFQHFEWAAERAPGAGLILHRLGLVAAATDRPEYAVRAFDRAARALPNSRVVALDLAKALERRKEYAEAAAKYAEEVDRTPDDGDLWYRLARAQFLAGDSAAAMRSVSNALGRLGEDGLRAYTLYGVLLDGNGRRAEARAAYDTILRRRPNDAGALYNKGLSFDSEHRVEEAAECYLAAATSAPDDPKLPIVLANLYSGASRDVCEGCRDAYERSPEHLDFAKAREHALRALKVSEGGDPAVVDLAVTIAIRIGAVAEFLAEVEALRAATERNSARRILDRAAKSLRAARDR